MHFFYIDESGDTGADLGNQEQPILVLGGVDVKDSGWMTTQTELSSIINSYFDNQIPEDFELHATDLLCPDGAGPFAGHPMERRTALADRVLDLIADRGHSVHYFGIDKAALVESVCECETVYDTSVPWLLAYDYLITYLNWYVKERLGHTARGMIIHDEKDELHDVVERIAHERRFEGPLTHRVKWIVEFSYPVDSRKNPMVQISDLVSYCIRKFLEIDRGFHEDWDDDAKRFYANCFAKIDGRVRRKELVARGGHGFAGLNQHLGRIRATPHRLWRTNWGI